MHLMSPLLIEVDLLTCVSCPSLCIICTQPPPYQKQIDEHLQKWSPPKSGPILVFPVRQNMCRREIGATGMIYFEGCRSVAKIIALSRRDNLQVLQVCQMMSITSFEPLSPVVGLKFGLQRKIFSQFYRICILCQDSCFDRRNNLIA